MAGLACSLSQLWPAHAQAQPAEPVDFEWTAPSGCPQREDVQAGIRKLAGPRKSSSVPLRAEATITRSESGELHLRLVLHAGDMLEERNIDGSSCSALAGATAVAIALLFRSGGLHNDNPDANAPPTEGVPEDGPRDAKPVSAPAPPAPPAGANPRATRRWHGLLQLPLGALGIGPLPAPSFGVAAAAGAAFDDWRFLARGALWFPKQVVTTRDFRQYGADPQLLTATLQVCRALLRSRFELAPCATLSVLHLSARGQGAHIAAHTDQTTWVAVGVGARGELHVSRWLSLLVGVEGELETSRPRLALSGVGPVATLLPAAATLTVGPEWIF